MWKAALVGAVALATIGSSLAFAEENYAAEKARPVAHSGVVLTEGHIAQAKAMLRLTPAQRPYWGAVEAALRDLVRHQGDITPARVHRVIAAAQPLIRVLDQEQKQNALSMVRALGIGSMAAAY